MLIAKRSNFLETETAFEILKRAENLSKSGRSIINLGIGQPDFIPPQYVINQAIKNLNSKNHGYSNAKGLLDLRKVISQKLNDKHNCEINSEQILISPGGKVIIYITIMMLAEKNCEVIIPDPSFPIYRSIINYSGAKTVTVPLKEKNNFSISGNEIASKLNSKTRLIILNSPSNPTGGVYKKKELQILLNALKKFPNVFILSDEIYSDFVFKNNNTSLLEYEFIRNRLIVLNGLSKNFAMTGWRLGWGVFPNSLIDLAEKFAINIFSCVNISTQFAAISAVNGSQKIVNKMKNVYFKRSKIMTELLNEIDGFHCIQPEGAFYCFPNIIETGYTSDILQNKLLEEVGVATISGSSFGEYGNGFLRFSCANSEENIVKACSKIKKWILK